MKQFLRNSLSILIGFLVTAGTGAWAAGPHGLDGENWAQEIESQFAGVKGYSAVIVHNGGYVLQKAGGGAAPGKAMEWTSYANIGSAKKMVASLLMMRLIEDKVGRAKLNEIRAQIDKPAYLFLPQKVRQAVPAQNRKITIRLLLQHRSGIRTEHSSGNPIHDLLKPVKQSDFLQREYNNTNTKLLTYIIVGYAAPHIIAETDQMIAAQNLSPTDDKIIQKVGYYYYGLVLNRLLKKAYKQPFGTCRPKEHIIDWPNRHIALMFAKKSSPANSGGVYQQGPTVGHCKAMGGWYFSTRDLARLFRDLGTMNGVLSITTYNWMFKHDGTQSERLHRLGWSAWTVSPKLQTDFGWTALPFHDGSHTISHHGKSVTSRAAILRLPGGYHSVAQVNSGEMDARDIAKALKNAFARSIP